MGKDTEIQWCKHTFNPWRGCTKVSPGCTNCYAEAMSNRNPKTLGVWGDNGTRIVAAEAGWNAVRKWDQMAAKAGERHRVFCASLADVFEDWEGPMLNSHEQEMMINESTGLWSSQPKFLTTGGVIRPLTMDDVRERLFDTISETQNLDWLLVTKRIENLEGILPWTSDHAGMYRHRFWENVWLGTTVENQEQADKRIPILLNTPAKVRFLSVEPLLGPVDISKHLRKCEQCGGAGEYKVKHANGSATFVCPCHGSSNTITWVIIGGESGPKARPCNIAWIRSIVKQCKDAGVPCFVKQLGSEPRPSPLPSDVCVRFIKDSHGGDPSEWPEDLRVREFPEV